MKQRSFKKIIAIFVVIIILIGGIILLQHWSGTKQNATDNNISSANSVTSPPLRTACDAECTQHIQKMLDDYRKKNNIPGIQMTINLANQPMQTFVSGSVDKAGTKPVTKDTLFEIASNTKSFTAAIILRLAAEGKLSLTDTIGKWFPNEYPAWNNVTIDQLLHMSSTVFDTLEYDGGIFKKAYIADPTHIWTAKALINFAYKKGPFCSRTVAAYGTPFCAEQPGKGWAYSNTNYMLLTEIAERASGKSFKDLLEQNIFKPLKLKSAIYEPEKNPADIKKLARAYDNDPEDKTYQQDVTEFSLSPARGAGAIIATTEDLAKWVRALFSGKVLPAKESAAIKNAANTICMKDTSECKAGDSLPANARKTGSYGYGMMRFPRFPSQVPNKDDNTENSGLWLHFGSSMGHESVYLYDQKHDFVFVAAQNIMPKGQFLDLAFVVEKYLFPDIK